MTEEFSNQPQRQATTERGRALRVAIFGSCVSRDTCEHLLGARVVEYVARQSMISSLCPVGARRFPTDKLASDFQARMFKGDQVADAVERITRASADIVLIDLVDERRGVWQFPDGSFLTNSLEASRAGIDEWAPEAGGRLIAFGTDEHYGLWQRGLETVLSQFRAIKVPLILLDIAWAEAYDGSRLPQGIRSELGRTLRRAQRSWHQLRRAVRRGESLATAFQSLQNLQATPAEQLAVEAREGNTLFLRYRNAARKALLASAKPTIGDQGRRFIITRTRENVRTTDDHRWGPAPFHYRPADYESIAEEIVLLLTKGEAA